MTKKKLESMKKAVKNVARAARAAKSKKQAKPVAPQVEWVDTPESSNIAKFGYGSTTLSVQFKNGGRYEYLDVPITLFADMKAAESKGRFLNENVKGSYAFRKVS
jgi:hypothetical protein